MQVEDSSIDEPPELLENKDYRPFMQLEDSAVDEPLAEAEKQELRLSMQLGDSLIDEPRELPDNQAAGPSVQLEDLTIDGAPEPLETQDQRPNAELEDSPIDESLEPPENREQRPSLQPERSNVDEPPDPAEDRKHEISPQLQDSTMDEPLENPEQSLPMQLGDPATGEPPERSEKQELPNIEKCNIAPEVDDWQSGELLVESKDDDFSTPNDEIQMPDKESEEATDAIETVKGGGGKRKRGRSSKAQSRAPVRKTVEEEVCFICFDGGDLVLCDRRGCPKAYHPQCVNRDEAFFRSKGRWNCGWHLCSNCERNAHYMCLTCTYSLCKACTKDNVILCVRGNKGFCETCMRTIMLIEKSQQENSEMAQVDFDDKSSWEYLFKDYWIDLKGKLDLTLDELTQAKNPYKGSDTVTLKSEVADESYDVDNDNEGSNSDDSSGKIEPTISKRKKPKKRLSKTQTKGGEASSAAVPIETSQPGGYEWASKELLDFVMHMRNGDKSVLSQFDVQALLLEYIKKNKLRDPRRKSQIICDFRLQNLFGKARVGHFEMLKLLESHFLIKEDLHADDLQGSVVDTEASHVETDGNETLTKANKDRRRKTRKNKGPQSNLDDYAAIDIHNINLIYLRRNLVEDLLEDIDRFHDKVVGSFVRIRISGTGQKQDVYRLVQVVGTSKAAEPYKIGKRMTDIMLEILNLNKTEVISIDIISNQEFTEDECKRLRQSIKCGLINRMTVGDILDKAMELQAVRVNDWLGTEVVRLSHLRDRASDFGRRKELRECVEKLQLLKTPEERQRRLEEIPEVHADPNMDPSYESEEDGSENDKKQENYARGRDASFSRGRREPISPRKEISSFNDSWSGTTKSPSTNWELRRSMSDKGFSNKGKEATSPVHSMNDNSVFQVRDRDSVQSSSFEKSKAASITESFSGFASETSSVTPSGLSHSVAKISETEKIWHYKDPSGTVQGPFSMVQLRKWSNTGYFPTSLTVWKTTEGPDDSMLLTDALAEIFPKDSSGNNLSKDQKAQQNSVRTSGERHNFDQNHGNIGFLGQKLETNSSVVGQSPELSTNGWGPEYRNGNDPSNLPSPTPLQTQIRSHTHESGQYTHSSSSPSTSLKHSGIGGTGGSNLSHSHASLSQESSISNSPNFENNTSQVTLPGESKGPTNSSLNLVQSAPNQSSSTGNFQVPAQQPGYGQHQWGEASTVHNPASSFNAGNSTGNFPNTGFSSLPPIPGNQWETNSQLPPPPPPPPPPNMPWAMVATENPNLRPEIPNNAWGSVPANPATNWVGPPQGIANMNWAPGTANLNWPVPANPHMNWGPSQVPPIPGNNTNMNWGGNANGQNWGPSVQGPGMGNMPVNTNMNWGHSNPNPSWGPPAGNQGVWQQPSYGSGGGAGGRYSSMTSVVCKYHENGHCKKGASCDFLHS